MGTWKSCTNVDHIATERWGPPLVDADWHTFCQAKNEGIEGDWGEMYDSYKEMSRSVGGGGGKKPQEAKKANALWKMKAAKDAGEEYHDPDRKGNVLGETRHD